MGHRYEAPASPRTGLKIVWLVSALALAAMRPEMAIARNLPEIWLAPLSRDNTVNHIGSADYFDLFTPHASWSFVARHVSVFKLYPYFVSRATDTQLNTVLQDLKRRRIALALEARVLTEDGYCKSDGGESTLWLLKHIRRLNGDLEYLAMDEPLLHWTSRKSCHAPIDQVARNVAGSVARFRQVFPGLKVGDIEPVAEWDKGSDPVPAILQWIDAYRRAAGTDLAFLHADVGWSKPWQAAVQKLGLRLRARAIPFGIIYNGEDGASTDAMWAAQATAHFESYERDETDAIDAAIFQSWVPRPSRVLPETDPTSLTGVVLRYLEAKNIHPSSR